VDHHVHLAREFRKVLLAQAQRRRMHISFEDTDLVRDAVLEVVTQLLAQAAEGRSA
jgi:hypothetical protein